MLISVFLLLLSAGINAADNWYTIFPRQMGDGDVNDRIRQNLIDLVGQDNIHHSHSLALKGHLYWYAKLNDQQKNTVAGYDGVRYVATPEPDSDSSSQFSPVNKIRAPSTTKDPVNQKDAKDHLKIISQGKDPKQDWNDLTGYWYHTSAGKDISIYIIDTGLYKHANEFPSTDGKIRFLHAGPFADTEENDSEQANNPGKGHGTCMASVALGAKDGVAKRADLVMVRADTFSKTNKVPDPLAVAPERWLDGLSEVYDDIDRNTLAGKAVLSMSWGWYPRKEKEYNDCLVDAYTALLKGIISKDVTPVVAAGQVKGYPLPGNFPALQTYPALLANNGNGGIDELIVITNVDKDGDYSPDAYYAKNTIAGMGDQAHCASSEGGTENDYHDEAGTSPATAAAAGLIANFLAEGYVASDARNELVNEAWVRTKGGPKVIWNTIDSRKLPPT